MSCIDLYKKRVGVNGIVDPKTRLIYEARKNFERSLKNDPSSLKVRITDVGEVGFSENTKTVTCIINDFSTNDQKSFDEKVLYTRYDEEVGIGSYVEFDNFIWLVIFKEHISSNAYKSFIMRKCNQILKYEYKGKVYDVPSVVKNLTQYSDGLQDIVYTSVPDGKRSITYSTNEITKNIGLGHRFLINYQKAYRITHLQNFEYQDHYDIGNGISTCIAVYTSLRKDDNEEENLAYNKDTGTNIVSEDKLVVGSSITYEVDIDECKWQVEYMSDKDSYVNVSTVDKRCKVLLDMNFDLVGEKFKLKALSLNDEVIFEKNITVVSFI